MICKEISPSKNREGRKGGKRETGSHSYPDDQSVWRGQEMERGLESTEITKTFRISRSLIKATAQSVSDPSNAKAQINLRVTIKMLGILGQKKLKFSYCASLVNLKFWFFTLGKWSYLCTDKCDKIHIVQLVKCLIFLNTKFSF